MIGQTMPNVLRGRHGVMRAWRPGHDDRDAADRHRTAAALAAKNAASELPDRRRRKDLTLRTVAHFPHYIGVRASLILRR